MPARYETIPTTPPNTVSATAIMPKEPELPVAVSDDARPVAEAEPAIPFLAFTGMNDTTADYRMTERLYARAKAGTPRGLVNRIDAGHQEPSNWEGWLEYDGYNPKMAQFVVGWMKLFLDGVSTDRGVDWDELIFGDSDVALCHGGDGAMARCETHRS